MRILILGGTGMLGHQLYQYLLVRFPDTYATIRQNCTGYKQGKLFNGGRIIESVDVKDFPVLAGIMKCVKPDVILNCIGVTKRRKEAEEAIHTITLNALFPHLLAEWAHNNSAKVINFSTDCVFDGTAGNYLDDSATSATDLYGKTKALGEICCENALTLRSSFIGTELDEGTELLEWFLAQTGTIQGYKNAIYSGLTTLELSRIVEKILVNHHEARGVYNVSSDPISKYDLLVLIRDKTNHNVEIIPDETVQCDRSLNSARFRREFDYTPPSWEAMIDEIANTIRQK